MSLFVVFPQLPAPSLCVCFQQQVPRGAPSIRPPWLWSVSSAAWSAWFTALTSPAASQCGWSYMCRSTSSLTVRLSHQPQTADAAFSTHTSVGAQSPGGGGWAGIFPPAVQGVWPALSLKERLRFALSATDWLCSPRDKKHPVLSCPTAICPQSIGEHWGQVTVTTCSTPSITLDPLTSSLMNFNVAPAEKI